MIHSYLKIEVLEIRVQMISVEGNGLIHKYPRVLLKLFDELPKFNLKTVKFFKHTMSAMDARLKPEREVSNFKLLIHISITSDNGVDEELRRVKRSD